MNSPFSISGNDLAQLGPDMAVNLFRELVWAEATRCQIARHLINVPSAITVSDGGIDAEITNNHEAGESFIRNGLTRYQIKAGEFSLNESSIKEILLVEGGSELKPRIKTCLDNGGSLVVVFTKWDNPDRIDNECRNKFIDVLRQIDEKYASANVEIWRQNTLCGLLKPFISLVLKTKGIDRTHYQSHQSWSSQGDMDVDSEMGEKQIGLMKSIRDALNSPGRGPIHLRIDGEPGIGKTKIVLEATRTDDLAHLVIYCDSARNFRDSDLMNELLREDNVFHIILVIDECDSENRAYIWNKLMPYAARVRLISIYNERDGAANITYLEVPPLVKEQISKILVGVYGIPEDQAFRWSEFCGGSPRVAHAFGQSLKNNPDDLLKPPANVNLWERYIVGGDDPNSLRVLQRRIVLRHIALYKRFGYGSPYQNEARAIAQIIENADRQITWAVFQEIVQTLRRRKILQGEATLYISPKALHIYLWIDWWQTHGDKEEYLRIVGSQPKLLQGWSHEMFVYAKESRIAARVVKEMLGDEGPFLR